ncbi:tripartite tricarboxylate transporter substrate binding protein [Pannonibacter phragmitetus]|uniref:tripartite tricarboxylate transporter substrate binding protein n=1 Tax=Pannonibacter phragmitetus TaxID=121719 RepID=UPI000F44B7DF|nr:tripartite tricarboxylate transporter substrate binding protein [Pannonibacter phragmitetus]MBA4206321.1 tripartite tricarboxylate transporter substrate binding protein [Polymorphum sp.]
MSSAWIRYSAFACGLAALALSTPALAQDGGEWKPAGPVTLVLHTGPGGASDIFARTLARSLEPVIGQPLVIHNAQGAAGAKQMAVIRAAAADGLTLGVNTMSHFTAMQTNLKGTFAPEDFSWIAIFQFDPHVLMANPQSGMTSLSDLVEKAKASPDGQVTIGGFGSAGSVQHLAVSMLAKEAGFSVNWVGFNSTPEVITGLLGGYVDAAIANPGPALPFFEADRVVGLGILGHGRLESLPEVQTFAEQGFAVSPDWQQLRGLFGPPGIPEDLQEKIAAAFHKAQATEEFRNFETQSGVVSSTAGPAEYREYIKQMNEVAAETLKDAGLVQ